ncbi:MAG: bifunctional fructose-bisphosphatase/inositol-phosphate phosphatase [Candidatus Baldrarchaeia archaeon]
MLDLEKISEMFVELSNEVIKSTKKLRGRPEGRKIVGRNPAGEYTKFIDKIAEDTTLSFIREYFKDVRILSEESGEIIIGKKPNFTILIDPLDGSSNASRGIAFYCFSAAIATGNTLDNIIYGFVRDLVSGDVFEAIKGQGAYWNGDKMKPSHVKSLKDAMICLYAYNTDKSTIMSLISAVKKIRLLGAVALELCYVGCGAYDALVDVRGALKVTDIAAAKLIVEESGAIIRNGNGSPMNYKIDLSEKVSVIAASTPQLIEEILSLLKRGTVNVK